MKKTLILFVLSLFILLPVLGIGVYAADDVVFIGGEGDTYSTLKAAADALPPAGGTIVVRGPVVHGNNSADAITLPAKPLVITSVYGGKDYRTDGAYFGLGRTMKLSADLTFENIIIKQTHTNATYGNIYAQGHSITMGDGITTEAEAGTGKYPTVFGGFSAGDNGTGYSTDVTIKSGTWQNVFGGSYSGQFNGNSTVVMTGGAVVNVISGGSRNGTQVGNTKLTISGGNVYLACGGIYGVSGSSGSLTGDIEIDICGNSVIENNVFGVAYYGNIVFNGNVDIDIYGNANLKRHVYGGCLGVANKQNITYGNKGMLITVRENVTFTRPSDSSNVLSGGSSAGNVAGNVRIVIKDNVYFTGNVYGAGYSGSLVGDSTVEIYGGEVRVNFTAASRSGNVSGTATTLAYGGKIGYFASDSLYGVIATNSGTVGNAVVVVDGADVAGKVELKGANGTITLKSGKIGSTDACSVDLSAGKTLSVGGDIVASEIKGGGTLVIPSTSTVTTDALTGKLYLSILGDPIGDQVYITVNDVNTTGEVEYDPVDDEKLEKTVGASAVTYAIKYENRYATTKIRIYYYNPDLEGKQPQIVLKPGVYSSTAAGLSVTKGNDAGKNYIEADLEPGLYACKIYYNGSTDYRIKYFYVSGKEESHVYDLMLEPYVENSWSETVSSNLTDEIYELFGTEDLIGYEGFDTPTFSMENNVRNFMNNDMLCDYVDKLAENCDHLYLYYPFEESAMGNKTPILVFTADDISGMSLEEAAASIRSKGLREIVMITGNKHGNEPAGAEGALVFAKDLCGDYGREVLEKIGAIVIMPSVEVDNAQRFKRLTESGVNPNRDLVSLFLQSSINQVYIYNLFMPSVTIDCHEDSGNVDIDPADLSVENLDDICIRFSSNFNSPLYYGNVLKGGTFDATEILGNKIMMDAIERTKTVGLRGSLYYSGSTVPNTSSTYPCVRGSYAFLVETMRIWTGTGRYERAVFGVEQALKALIAEVIEYDGALAAEVKAAREAVASITDYDVDHVLAGKHSFSGSSYAIGDRPTIYVSGIWKDQNGTKKYNLADTLSNIITLPTAYVVSADVEGIDDILTLLDNHGIKYTKLKKGAALTLRKYSGGYTDTAIGLAESVTFENGAYAVTMNTSDAYLIAYLFEPNSHNYTDAEDHSISFAHIGYIKDGDGLYRSEENGVYLKIAELAAGSEITHASITVGVDLKVNAFVSLADDAGEATVRFTVDGAETVVSGTYDENVGLYRFVMPNMPPHGMTVEVKMELIVGGEVVDTVEGWTVRKYCDTLLASSAEELGLSDSAKTALYELVADILEYGAAAQNYKDYVSEDAPLANEGINGSSSFTELDSSVNVASCTGNSENGVKFLSVGVRFDSVIKIMYRFKAADVSKVTVIIDSAEYGKDDFEAAGNGEYVVYSDAVLPTQFDGKVYATAYVDDVECQTVEYSVTTFVYEMQNDTDEGELSEVARLVRRLYRYGVSSKTYAKAVN